MSDGCQTFAQWFDTSTPERTLATPVLTGAMLASARFDVHLSVFKSVVEANEDALAICACVDESIVIVHANPAFCALTGYELTDLYARRYDFMIAADAPPAERALLQETFVAKRPATLKIRCMQRDGAALSLALRVTPLPNAAGFTTHYLITLREIDEAQHRVEHLRFLAHYDTLTGLPNRRLLLDRLDRALARYERYGEGFSVAFVDLDRFKQINDRFGHAAGDAFLKHVARCLAASVRASDTVGRLGGDEFLLLLNDVSSTAEVHDSLVRVLASLGEPFMVEGGAIEVSCSIGIAVCPRDGTTAPDLLERADAAMYDVKKGTAACLFDGPQPTFLE